MKLIYIGYILAAFLLVQSVWYIIFLAIQSQSLLYKVTEVLSVTTTGFSGTVGLSDFLTGTLPPKCIQTEGWSTTKFPVLETAVPTHCVCHGKFSLSLRDILCFSTQKSKCGWKQKQGAVSALHLQETDLFLCGEELGAIIKTSQFSWPEMRQAWFPLINKIALPSPKLHFARK